MLKNCSKKFETKGWFVKYVIFLCLWLFFLSKSLYYKEKLCLLFAWVLFKCTVHVFQENAFIIDLLQLYSLFESETIKFTLWSKLYIKLCIFLNLYFHLHNRQHENIVNAVQKDSLKRSCWLVKGNVLFTDWLLLHFDDFLWNQY